MWTSERWARLAATVLLPLSSLASCGPARSMPCGNDADCSKGDVEVAYCLRRQCVECVTSASCGEDKTCAEGRCRARCRGDDDCLAPEACEGGLCGDP